MSRVLDEGDQNIERPSNQTKDPQKSRKMLEMAKRRGQSPKASHTRATREPRKKRETCSSASLNVLERQSDRQSGTRKIFLIIRTLIGHSLSLRGLGEGILLELGG